MVNSTKAQNLTALIIISAVIYLANYPQIYAGCIINNDYHYVAFHNNVWAAILDQSKRLIPFASIINNLIMTYVFSYSAQLARNTIVLLGLIPVSFIFYHIYRRCFGLPYVSAIVASTLPPVLPGQSLIPVFINGSYHTYALVPSLLFFIASYHYLEKKSKPIGFVALLFFVVSMFSTEVAVFTAIPFLFALFVTFWDRSKLRLRRLLNYCAIIIAFRLVIYLLLPNKSAAYQMDISGEHLMRMRGCIESFSLLGNNLCFSTYSTYVVLGLGFISFLMLTIRKIFKKEPFCKMGYGTNWWLVSGFSLSWMLLTAIPFVVLSRHTFTSRYGYTAAFGFSLLLVSAAHTCVRIRNSATIIKILLISLLLLAGVSKYEYSRKYYGEKTLMAEFIKDNLSDIDFPRGSQVIILGGGLAYKLGTFSDLSWSTGFLNYHLNRDDLIGLISNHKSFKDRRRRGFPNPQKPIFIFEYRNKTKELIRYKYLLQVRRNKKWVIYSVGLNDGRLATYASGSGEDQCLEAINQLELGGQSRDQIYGYGDIKESYRALP